MAKAPAAIPVEISTVGEWKAGKMYGEGAYTHADGTETLGGWKFGCPWNAVVYDSAGKLKSSYKDGVPQ